MGPRRRALIAALLLLLYSCGGKEAELVREETWDLSSGREIGRANWGGDGWHLSGREQFRSPAALRILLPEGREVEGVFGMARVLRDANQIVHVSLKMSPDTGDGAYHQLRRLLQDLRASPEAFEILDRWNAAGPRSQEGEAFIFNFPKGQGRVSMGVDADWVWAGSSGRNWVVTVSFSWD
jgi:hypothetical protein